MQSLIVIAGPIGAGKSSVATELAHRLGSEGLSTAHSDLDDIAFAQNGGDFDMAEYWRRAGVAHCALVRGWFAAGVEVVVVHGPFFESGSYDELFAACPEGGRYLHVLLTVDTAIALERVTSDPLRRPDAMSKDPGFLRSTHQRFGELTDGLPSIDLALDTSQMSVSDIVARLCPLVWSPGQ